MADRGDGEAAPVHRGGREHGCGAARGSLPAARGAGHALRRWASHRGTGPRGGARARGPSALPPRLGKGDGEYETREEGPQALRSCGQAGGRRVACRGHLRLRAGPVRDHGDEGTHIHHGWLPRHGRVLPEQRLQGVVAQGTRARPGHRRPADGLQHVPGGAHIGRAQGVRGDRQPLLPAEEVHLSGGDGNRHRQHVRVGCWQPRLGHDRSALF
mmetsp:Transcript_6451/g.17543  ORF Transcript_6451/g.17543 Transcript_6451/m.17543 type:complete len:214 (+) Transcript_6451:825-1466(+)